MDKSTALLGAGAGTLIGPSTASWLVADLSKASALSFLGPIPDAAQAELSVSIAVCVTWIAVHLFQCWMEKSNTKALKLLPPPDPTRDQPALEPIPDKRALAG